MSSQTTPSDKYDVDLGELGAKLEIARTENEADVAIVEHTLPPHTLAAPLHRHSREDEISYVLEGEMTVLAGDEIWTVPADEATVKGRNVWHTFWNASDEPLRFLEIIAPGEFSEFFMEISQVYPVDPADEEALARFEEICERYGFEADLESVPKLCEEHGLQI
ncbi:Cupin 2 conserved barrel domain protein (plasmid) [Haloterrigena turkmenica DSM 5511]|uniref:Cupin 2 conserved barrel domain protein n=1 Tax=Haloterrigena turkmenica (strain ATCC 51198 / DSM 5511 / JCM 9101 / NCIMB 13204 / VKM B-1734 / 4k) TaxID=543526 RepID=D2S111_HALTV|nr:cupin domain-containing protein [Haloterrigena turkmenica]ADB63058.1 Cupin 2 conserved barrel domain protein [Haloterrigena turkmenica DSM 5511]